MLSTAKNSSQVRSSSSSSTASPPSLIPASTRNHPAALEPLSRTSWTKSRTWEGGGLVSHHVYWLALAIGLLGTERRNPVASFFLDDGRVLAVSLCRRGKQGLPGLNRNVAGLARAAFSPLIYIRSVWIDELGSLTAKIVDKLMSPIFSGGGSGKEFIAGRGQPLCLYTPEDQILSIAMLYTCYVNHPTPSEHAMLS